MSKQAIAANLVQHKTMLAEKYDRLIKTISSKPRRERYKRQAAKYRRQAADFARLAQ